MILDGPVVIRFGEMILDEKALQADRERWHKTVILPGITVGDQKLSDLMALRALLFESTPVIISAAEDDDPVVLDAELIRFPYIIHSARGGVLYQSATGFECFALRLVPRSGGRIVAVELDSESNVAVNNFVTDLGRGLFAEFGNGNLRLDFYFSHYENLPTLEPPEGYQEEVTSHDEDAID